MPESLTTRRLNLKLLGPENLSEAHALFADPGHTVGQGPHRNSEDTLTWLSRRQDRYQQLGLAWYGLWDQKEILVGTCGAFVGDRCGDEPEIGYEVGRQHRNLGFASEAATAVTDTIHNAGHRRVWATIRPTNTASIRIVEKGDYVRDRDEPDVKGSLLYYVHYRLTQAWRLFPANSQDR